MYEPHMHAQIFKAKYFHRMYILHNLELSQSNRKQRRKYILFYSMDFEKKNSSRKEYF